ncbi:MAG: hypothetical protein JWO38_2994 [Gemmataceae bacterium]|nr:hypothetical protein [Gemmataceae bacterium]
MIQTFERDGVRLQYPATWVVELGETAEEGGWTVTIQSPETAFALVSLRPDADNPADLAGQTLDALTAEYKELDAEPAVETIAGRPAVGHDIDFLTVDTPVTCWTRCLDTSGGPLLVMCQTSEFDRARHELGLRAICASLKIDEE